MTDLPRSPKLKGWHFDRVAIVYVRQSTPQQVLEHQESTARQYGLVNRAVDLGWIRERVRSSTTTWARVASPSKDAWGLSAY
jgi:hypothetical protein